MENWIEQLLTNIDELEDEGTKQKILESCGSRCPFSHLPDEKLIQLRDQADNEKELLELLSVHWRLTKEEGKYYVIFDRCYCPLVNNRIETASKSMCYCTLGSLKHKFAIALGRSVDVIMLKTVLQGHQECKFEVRI